MFRGGKAVAAYPVLTCGAGARRAGRGGRPRPRTWIGQIIAVASLAAHLLCWHYDLTDADLDQLLAFRRADERRSTGLREVIRDRDGAIRPKSLSRWRRLTLLAQGTMPPMMLLEDAEDLCDFCEATGRTVSPAGNGRLKSSPPAQAERSRDCSDGRTRPDHPGPHGRRQGDGGPARSARPARRPATMSRRSPAKAQEGLKNIDGGAGVGDDTLLAIQQGPDRSSARSGNHGRGDRDRLQRGRGIRRRDGQDSSPFGRRCRKSPRSQGKTNEDQFTLEEAKKGRRST